MKLFKDRELKEEIATLDLDSLIAGETKVYEFYVYNELDVPVEKLQFEVFNKELVILNFPKELQAKEIGMLQVKWSASLTLKKGLKAELSIKGYEIYKPE